LKKATLRDIRPRFFNDKTLYGTCIRPLILISPEINNLHTVEAKFLFVLVIIPLRKITVKLSDEEYLAFQSEANNSGLKPDEMMLKIIKYYQIVERNRKKFRQTTLIPEP